MITITGIVLTYNCIYSIKHCIESLKKFDDIIVLDSNSTDGTLEYLEKQDNVTVFTGPQITGKWINAYNFLIRECKTSHVYYLDSDEMINVDIYDELKDLWEKESDAFPVSARATIVYQDKCKKERYPDPQFRGGPVDKLRYYNPRNETHDMIDARFSGTSPIFKKIKHIIVHFRNIDNEHYRKRLEILQGKLKKLPNVRSLYDEYNVNTFEDLIEFMKNMPVFPLEDVVKEGYILPRKKRLMEALK